MKQKLLSILALLCLTVSSAWAQTTHVVTQATVDNFFNGDGYTLGSGVAAGDVLDFQGEIDLQHSLIVNKQVTIKSSTKDAVVKLNTPEGSPTLSKTEYPTKSFVINKAGSGTAVQDIDLQNTEAWLYNTSNVTLTGVTFRVEDVRVGSSVGHVSVRYSEQVTFDGCTIYTKNNGGSSACVLTGSSNCSFKNCLFENEGNVGNIMYLGNPYNINDIPDGFPKEKNQVVSNDNTLLNCTFTVEAGSSISNLQINGKRERIEGCKVYNFGVSFSTNATSSDDGYTILNNTFTNGLTVPNYSTAEGNTVSKASGNALILNQYSTATGNTVYGTVNFNNNNAVLTNNQVFGRVTSSRTGCTITGNTVITSETYAVSLSSTSDTANNTVTDNVLIAAELKGDAAVESKSASNTISNNKTEGSAGGSVTWTYDFAAKALVLGGTGAMDNYDPATNPAPWTFLADKTERIIVGEGVSAIGANAFAGFTGVNTVIANGTTPPSLGSGAFDTNATIAAYVPAGTAAAYQTAWGASVASIADYMSCGADAKALYDASTKTLTIAGNGAMTDFASSNQPWKALKGDIETVVIENTVTAIGDNAFSGCSALSAVYVEGSGVIVGTDAFSGNADGRKIFVPVADVIDYTADWTAYAADIRSTGYCGAEGNETDVVWEFNANTMGLTISGTGPMADNGYKQWSDVRTSIESATIESGVTTIGNAAFTSCSKLAAVSIPAGVTSIGSNAFSTCTALLSVSIPSSVTTIGNYAFQKCSSMTAVNIPDGVTSIGSYVFQDCSELTAITIPDDVTSIDQNAFQRCSKLTTVNIPDGVTSIDQYAFDGCTLLTAINIPASVANFGNFAFQNCTNLTAVTIADGVSSIGKYAFQGCSELESVSFPASVTSIGSYSFRNCSKLAKVYIYAPSLTSYGYDAFDNNAEGRKIYVPASALDTYKTGWDDYAADIEAMIAANEGETGEYWATYYNSTTSFTADANTTVFQAALVGNHLTLKEVENREIPAGNAVILKSTAAIITLTPGETTATTLEGNSLQGTTAAIDGSAGNIYVLNKKAAGVGFYKLSDTGTLAANKAYLTYDGSTAPEFLGFGDDATSIKSLTPDPSPNGEGSEYYDLQGRRVAQPTKGMYIVNGKKVVIK